MDLIPSKHSRTPPRFDETQLFFGSLAVVAGLFLLISNAQILQPYLDEAGVSNGVATAVLAVAKPIGLFPKLVEAERRQAVKKKKADRPKS